MFIVILFRSLSRLHMYSIMRFMLLLVILNFLSQQPCLATTCVSVVQSVLKYVNSIYFDSLSRQIDSFVAHFYVFEIISTWFDYTCQVVVLCWLVNVMNVLAVSDRVHCCEEVLINLHKVFCIAVAVMLSSVNSLRLLVWVRPLLRCHWSMLFVVVNIIESSAVYYWAMVYITISISTLVMVIYFMYSISFVFVLQVEWSCSILTVLLLKHSSHCDRSTLIFSNNKLWNNLSMVLFFFKILVT